MKAKTKWFIEPLSQITNRSLCDLLGENAIQESVECSDGIKRDLYLARSFDDIWRYHHSKLSCNFYKQGDRGGLPQRWYPPKRKKDESAETATKK
jgi:hypothetical protein